ncbi:hypothetical protein Q1695_016391 [Nippostrongylus brasiliensis]|nr:hypothetical protein Q1695_016391 [Nippostrongylus brasiliensis]
MSDKPNLVLDDEFLQPKTPDEVRRYVILDAPNLMHMTKEESETNKVSAGGLLAVMRFFIKNGFDVVAVSQWKYTKDTTVAHKFVVDKLESIGLIYLAEGHALDDIVALEMAHTTDGVVVSNDQFEDHMQHSDRYCYTCERCVSIKLDRVKPSQRFTMSSNGHYIVDHVFEFLRRSHSRVSSATSSLHDAFFSTPDNIRHEIVQEHRANWSPEYRDRTISIIDELLTRIRQEISLIALVRNHRYLIGVWGGSITSVLLTLLGLHLWYWCDPSFQQMAPVATRRNQTQKKKTAAIQRQESNRIVPSHLNREPNHAPKVTCFFDESLLTCDICLEVMHNAMNVSPCNHKFCAGCIYEWNSLNAKCPKCRWSAVDITRDPTINAIIDQYLIAFPDKQRDAAQLIELDERELDHLEKWERKRDSDEGDYEYDMDDDYFESEGSDAFEVQDDEQFEGNDDDNGSGMDYSSSERWSDDDINDSYEDDEDEGDSDIQDEYMSRRNLEKARMERLRREKEERERMKQMEAEKSRRTSATSKKEKTRELRCGNGGNGRSGNRGRSNVATNPPTSSSRSIITRSMSRLSGL